MYEVDHPEHKATLRRLGRLLKKSLPNESMNFTLFLFTENPNTLFYLSSVERSSGLAAIKEWVARQESTGEGGTQGS